MSLQALLVGRILSSSSDYEDLWDGLWDAQPEIERSDFYARYPKFASCFEDAHYGVGERITTPGRARTRAPTGGAGSPGCRLPIICRSRPKSSYAPICIMAMRDGGKQMTSSSNRFEGWPETPQVSILMLEREASSCS